MYNCPCNTPVKKCCKSKKPDFYAQFSVLANPPSNTDLPLSILFEGGNQIVLHQNSEITLPAGYLYLIDYLFLATPEANGYMQITPKINGSLNTLYSYFAPAGSQERNVSASGSFTTNAAASENATLSFHLTYPATVRNIDISGTVSVTPLMKIR